MGARGAVLNGQPILVGGLQWILGAARQGVENRGALHPMLRRGAAVWWGARAGRDMQWAGARGLQGLPLDHGPQPQPHQLVAHQHPRHHLLSPAVGRGTGSRHVGELHPTGELHQLPRGPQGPWHPLPDTGLPQLVGDGVELGRLRGYWQPQNTGSTQAVTGGGMAGMVKLTPGTSNAIGSWRGKLSIGGSKEG